MEKYVLINEIASFCFDYGIFNRDVGATEVKKGIGHMLDTADLIESLINTILSKVSYIKKADLKKIEEILLELERIRLGFEFSDLNKHSEKSYL